MAPLRLSRGSLGIVLLVAVLVPGCTLNTHGELSFDSVPGDDAGFDAQLQDDASGPDAPHPVEASPQDGPGDGGVDVLEPLDAEDGSDGPDVASDGDGSDVIDAPEEPEAAPLCNPAACALGCNTILDRCQRLKPANFDPSPFHDQLSAGVEAAAAEVITVDTDDGHIWSSAKTYRAAGQAGKVVSGIYFGTAAQPGGSALAVFGMSTLQLAAGSKIVVIGKNPVAFYVVGDVTLWGMIEANGSGRASGPGGGDGGDKDGHDAQACGTDSFGKGGAQAGSGQDQLEAGGGGGGALAAGGTGGKGEYGTLTSAGGIGGLAISTTQFLIPLSGGCGGGAGGRP